LRYAKIPVTYNYYLLI